MNIIPDILNIYFLDNRHNRVLKNFKIESINIISLSSAFKLAGPISSTPDEQIQYGFEFKGQLPRKNNCYPVF